MEQSFTARGDGEKLIDTKVGGVHLADKELRPFTLVSRLVSIRPSQSPLSDKLCSMSVHRSVHDLEYHSISSANVTL